MDFRAGIDAAQLPVYHKHDQQWVSWLKVFALCSTLGWCNVVCPFGPSLHGKFFQTRVGSKEEAMIVAELSAEAAKCLLPGHFGQTNFI